MLVILLFCLLNVISCRPSLFLFFLRKRISTSDTVVGCHGNLLFLKTLDVLVPTVVTKYVSLRNENGFLP